jgi:hypothetical protein
VMAIGRWGNLYELMVVPGGVCLPRQAMGTPRIILTGVESA